jgi:hypothetical protein
VLDYLIYYYPNISTLIVLGNSKGIVFYFHSTGSLFFLKKYLKFISKTIKSDVKAMHHLFSNLKVLFRLEIRVLNYL